MFPIKTRNQHPMPRVLALALRYVIVRASSGG
jgi:hypothetical protein